MGSGSTMAPDSFSRVAHGTHNPATRAPSSSRIDHQSTSVSRSQTPQ